MGAAFGFINDVLSKQTFLVGERITYADISCCLTLKSAFENVLTAEFRSGFPHVTRWFNTVMNQPGVKSVVGDVTMCEKEAQFDAKKYNEMAGKPQKEKAKKEPKKQEPKKEKKAEPRPAAPCGRVPTNTLTNLPCLSWLQILSEVCSNVSKSSASTPSPPLSSVVRPMT